ncbi:uncharacterized protein EDB91DRAFT_1160518 [Suillus paluster]|uniref:uncharacterized protein n=1 Tax=Suillus paluster TaxID=48578 RepID=UPI001B85C983|nr:uncharacterized protein EDB91DRAFT_1160518 [Suillus paluster]KAG1728837.1 hypothetical protein EDB91DRAFT_1160518 [Suillus paluster]
MYFPSAIVRANKALPDQIYTSGSHVMLSENVSGFPCPEAIRSLISFQDSMYYQWHLAGTQRPQRIALMGTVVFLPGKQKIEQSQLPTRFSCGKKATVSIEVACDGCRLEFEQIFSSPPLAFDLMEIG